MDAGSWTYEIETNDVHEVYVYKDKDKFDCREYLQIFIMKQTKK